MKRRTFLTAASTIGIVSAASSATVVSSVYNDISTNILLEEFKPSSKNVLDKFLSDVSENATSLGIDSKIAKRLAMPVRIISNESKKNNQNISYKNKAGQTISICTINGKSSLKIMHTA